MPKRIWSAVGLTWLAGCLGGGGGSEDEATRRSRQKIELQACVRQKLPPPEDTFAEWTVSGYVLVKAYLQCKDAPGETTSEDFRATVQELVVPLEEDPSRLRVLASPGDSP